MLNGCHRGGEYGTITVRVMLSPQRRKVHGIYLFQYTGTPVITRYTHQNWLNCQSSPKASRKSATLTIGFSSLSQLSTSKARPAIWAAALSEAISLKRRSSSAFSLKKASRRARVFGSSFGGDPERSEKNEEVERGESGNCIILSQWFSYSSGTPREKGNDTKLSVQPANLNLFVFSIANYICSSQELRTM